MLLQQAGIDYRLNQKQKQFSKASSSSLMLLKKGVWLYFFLLLSEGALRKWVLPGLSTPLLIIRDPLALWIIITSARKGFFAYTGFSIAMVIIGLVSFFTTLFIGHGNLFVALFGMRILVLHFPLMFVIGNLFSRQDVLNLGRIALWITPFMTVLIALQFYSPQTAWINRGIGGNTEGGGFTGALGYFRPPGTFSFTNGVALFYGFIAVFIFYFLLYPRLVPKWLIITSAICLLASIPLSISRTLFFSVLVSSFFMLVAIMKNPRHLAAFVLSVTGLFIFLMLSKNVSFLKPAIEAFFSRFETANEAEGGVKGVLADRYLGGMVGAITKSSINLPFFGYGIGMGTNVGSNLLTGKTTFLVSEGEWGRLIGEMGLLSGLLVIIIRLGLTVRMFISCFKKISGNDLLPWMLLSFGIQQIPQGQWAQPTTLGFSVLIGGLILSSLKSSSKTNEATENKIADENNTDW